MFALRTPRENHLLAALPVADYERLLPHLERVPVELGWALYESGSHQGKRETDRLLSNKIAIVDQPS